MTANELAKLIKNTDGALWLEPYFDKIADTLIEQAQEIEQLRNFISLDKNRAKEWFAYELDNEIKRFKESE